jgi:hypothetical protein
MYSHSNYATSPAVVAFLVIYSLLFRSYWTKAALCRVIDIQYTVYNNQSVSKSFRELDVRNVMFFTVKNVTVEYRYSIRKWSFSGHLKIFNTMNWSKLAAIDSPQPLHENKNQLIIILFIYVVLSDHIVHCCIVALCIGLLSNMSIMSIRPNIFPITCCDNCCFLQIFKSVHLPKIRPYHTITPDHTDLLATFLLALFFSSPLLTRGPLYMSSISCRFQNITHWQYLFILLTFYLPGIVLLYSADNNMSQYIVRWAHSF